MILSGLAVPEDAISNLNEDINEDKDPEKRMSSKLNLSVFCSFPLLFPNFILLFFYFWHFHSFVFASWKHYCEEYTV